MTETSSRPRMPPPTSLPTPRLQLRPLRQSDFEAFCRTIVDDPAVMRFYHKYTDQMSAKERRARAKSDFFDHFADGVSRGYVAWVLESADSSIAKPGEFLGWCGITTAQLDETRWGPELQYMLASQAHGHGLATEAAQVVVEDAFHRIHLPRIHAVMDAPNIASRRVAERLGFVLQGDVRVYDSDDMVLYLKERDGP